MLRQQRGMFWIIGGLLGPMLAATAWGQIPGTQIPGTQIPGTQIPGTQIPGTQIPGTQIPGTQIPGTQIPGTQIPGTQIPGTQIPGAMPRALPTQPSVYSQAAGDGMFSAPYADPTIALDVRNDQLGLAGYGQPLSAQPLYSEPLVAPSMACDDCYQWHGLPNGLIYKSYLAGGKEPRFGSNLASIQGREWVWDGTIGGRVGLIRYGTTDEVFPEGWQLDVEGAAFTRLGVEHEFSRELISVDFRIGLPLTYRRGPWEAKFGYYHLCSHLGDEYMLLVPGATRINYVRDGFALGVAVRPTPALRLYSEVGWAFNADGGAEPWEFQFGIDYSRPGPTSAWGAPFFAVNAHLREEVDFGGGLTVQTGLQWAGTTGHLYRIGLHYFNGQADQRQFFATHEELIGLGMWYDY